MSKQEILDRLERIKDVMDTDVLNRYAIEGILNDINNLMTDIEENR